jgi:hypothetical protein
MMDISVLQVIKLIWLMLQNVTQRIKQPAIKIWDPYAILLDRKHGAMLITQIVNYVRHKME